MKKNRSVRALILTSLVFMLPALAFAAGEVQAQQLDRSFRSVGLVVNSFTTNIVTALATLFATAAMVAFFYGIVQYIWGVRDGKPEKVANGNKFMIWGLVALFVMFSVWGIIIFVQNIFGIQGNNTIVVPKVQIDGTTVTPAVIPTAPTGMQVQVNTDPSSPTYCQDKKAGTACNLAGGKSGTCGKNDAGVTGCYATPTGGIKCGANEALDANGNCVFVNGFN